MMAKASGPSEVMPIRLEAIPTHTDRRSGVEHPVPVVSRQRPGRDHLLCQRAVDITCRPRPRARLTPHVVDQHKVGRAVLSHQDRGDLAGMRPLVLAKGSLEREQVGEVGLQRVG